MPLRVLLIEDDPADAELTMMRLQRGLEPRFPGMSIEVAESLSEGIRKAHRIRPHIAVLDLSLPDSDPAQTLAEFRRMVPGVPALSYSGIDAADIIKNGDADGLCARVSGLVDLSVDEISKPEIIVPDFEKPVAKGPLWRRGIVFLFKHRGDIAWAATTLGIMLTAGLGWAQDWAQHHASAMAQHALGDPGLRAGECKGEGENRRCGPKAGSNADKWLAKLILVEQENLTLGQQVAKNTVKIDQVDKRTADMVIAMGSEKCVAAGGAPITIKAKTETGGFKVIRWCRWWGIDGDTPVVLEQVALENLSELDARIAAIAQKAAIKKAKKAAKKARSRR